MNIFTISLKTRYLLNWEIIYYQEKQIIKNVHVVSRLINSQNSNIDILNKCSIGHNKCIRIEKLWTNMINGKKDTIIEYHFPI